VEFLHKKGFDLDPNPNTKLPNEAYILLVKEYSTDISVKKESEKLILKDLHRKKESVSIDDFSEKSESDDSEKDEDILVKDSSGTKSTVDIRTEIRKPDIKLVGKIDLEKTMKPAAEKPASPKGEPAKKTEEPKAETKTAEKKKTATVKDTPAPEAVVDKKAKSNIDLHIVGRIDLDTISKETKQVKKEEPKGNQKEKQKKQQKKKLLKKLTCKRGTGKREKEGTICY